jgi:hypothetical protein
MSTEGAGERTGYAFRARLPGEALAELLEGQFASPGAEGSPRPAFLVLRKVDDAVFVSLGRGEAAALLEKWPEGQAFHAEADLRWRKEGQQYAVLLLTEADTPPDGVAWCDRKSFECLESAHGDRRGLMLWGTRPDPRSGPRAYREARIPRLLTYPVGTDLPPRVEYVLYRERTSQAVHWIRLVGLREDRREEKRDVA